MGVISGMGGSVDGHNTVRQWQVNETSDNQDYRASNTRKGTGRTAGRKDWSGSFTFYGSDPGVFPAATFTFKGLGAEQATGPAIVDSIEINFPIEEGGIINGTVNFSGNGALVREAGTGDDTSVPDPPSAIGAKAEFNTTEIADVRSATLNITAGNSEYGSSSTEGWTKRVPGAIDATATVEVYTDALSGLPAQGAVGVLDLFVDATDSWELEWMMVAGVEPTIDAESGDPVGATINYEFTGFNGGEVGGITRPGELTASWPEAA